MSEKRRHRCAIYTRKSHEEGLDQDFNSLDAQREACKSYVHSQAGLGWELIERTYDDGGISGGHMERDGLQTLLSDIKASKIDVVVVYKVDRLTRSITDFGKLIEVFDAHDVSFVSVTQAFNTTNSMGRLTLNVLLSFAQFEREVTAERIRDKIASSKQKGMWMGGRVPFGYRSENKKLVPNEREAEIIHSIFLLYLRDKNVRLVKSVLDRKRIVTRHRIDKSGKAIGATPFSAGHLYSILRNPIYAGRIRHKGNIYPGQHEAIVDEDAWNEVQEILAQQKTVRKSTSNQRPPALLAGLLFDEQGNKLVPHHANKKGKRYHYYVARNAGKKVELGFEPNDGLRLPMPMAEGTIRKILTEFLEDENALLCEVGTERIDAASIKRLLGAARKLAVQIREASPDELKVLYQRLIQNVVISQNSITIKIEPKSLFRDLPEGVWSDQAIEIATPIGFKKRGQELKLLIGEQRNHTSSPDPALIKLIAKAHLLKSEFEAGAVLSIKDFAAQYDLDHGDAKNLIPLCYLAPTIIEDILNGRQPADLTASQLRSANNLPIRWSKQREYLGFAA